MAGEAKWFKQTTKVLESNGGQITATSIVQANDDQLDTTDTGDYPLADFVLECDFTTAPTAGETIAIFARLRDVDATNHVPAPQADYPLVWIGEFVVDNVGSSTTMWLVALDCVLPIGGASISCDIYLKNDTGQTINTGWTLNCVAKTLGPA